MTTRPIPRFRALSLAATAFAMLALPPKGKGGEGDDDDDEEELGRVTRSRDALIGQYRTAEAAIDQLLIDNRNQRVKTKKQRDRADAAEAKVPKEGEVVISADDAKKWEAYKTLGEPEAVKTTLTETATLKETMAKNDRTDRFAKAAASEGFDPDALTMLATNDGLDLEATSVTKDGKTVTAYQIVKADKSKQDLGEYAKANWAKFAPVLIVAQENGRRAAPVAATNPANPAAQPATPAGGGVAWPTSSAGGVQPTAKPGESVIANAQKARNEGFDPLNPGGTAGA